MRLAYNKFKIPDVNIHNPLICDDCGNTVAMYLANKK